MKIGFCTIAYRHQKIKMREICKRIASCGYQQIEVWGGHLHNTSIEEIKQYLQEFSLKPLMLSPYFNFTDGDKQWKNSVVEARKYIDFARDLHCCLIRCFTGRKGSRYSEEKNWKDCVEGIKIVADLAGQYNIDIAIETHSDTLADSFWSIDRLIKEVNRENVGINFDIFNLWEVNDEFIFQVFKRLFPFIKHIHLKNARVKSYPSPFSLVHRKRTDLSSICLLEEGKINYEPYLNFLKEKNYRGGLSVEWFGKEIEEAGYRELSFLKKFWGIK